MSHRHFLFLCLHTAFAWVLFASPAAAQYTLPLYSLFLSDTDLQTLLDNPWTPVRFPAVINHNGQDYPCHVRFRGATSRELPKKSWKIFYDDDGPSGEEQSNLNSEYRDISYCRNALSMDIARQIDLPAPTTRHISLIVNGIYWGVYIEVEEVDDEFFERRNVSMHAFFKTNSHGARFAPPLYFERWPEYYEMEEAPAGTLDSLMVRMIMIQEASPEFFASISDQLFDRANIIKFFALNYALHNFDGVTKNIFVCEGDDGRYRLYPWDCDATLGNDWTGEFFEVSTLDPDPGTLTYQALFQRMIGLPGAEEEFRDQLRLIADSGFTFAAERAADYYDLIRHDAYLDTAKRGTNEDFEEGLSDLLEFINGRRDLLLDPPLIHRVNVEDCAVRGDYINFDADTLFLSARITEPSVTVFALVNDSTGLEYWIYLNDNGENGDSIPGDQWYSAEFILPDATPPYYYCFRVSQEGNVLVSFTPPSGNLQFSITPLSMPCIRRNPSPPTSDAITLHPSAFHNTPFFSVAIKNNTNQNMNISGSILRFGASYRMHRIGELAPLPPQSQIVFGRDSIMLDWLFDPPWKANLFFKPEPGDTLRLETSSGMLITETLFDSVVSADEPIGSVVINEINYNSDGDFDTRDWIELYAPWSTVDLTGWSLRDSDDNNLFLFPADKLLHQGQYLVIVENSEEFSKHFPKIVNFTGPLGFGLSSDQDEIRVFDSYGNIIDWVSYSSQPPWPVEADGTGKTLELSDYNQPNYGNQPWRASLDETPYGTPDAQNLFAPQDTVINPFIPERWQVAGIFPNPFNQQTRIQFDAVNEGTVEFSIYDLLGRHVKSLHASVAEPGRYSLFWPGDNDNGLAAATGIYFLRMESPVQTSVHKVVLLR